MKTFCITDFGATVCDQLQTKAIQKAIDTCFLSGGGQVRIPCGIFLTGGLRLRSNVELYLESGAILKGSQNSADYESFLQDELEPIQQETPDPDRHPYTIATSPWNYGLIHAIGAENIAIIGEKGSYLDGSNAYDERCEDGYRGPHGFSAWQCKNIRLEGYTVVNAGNWAHAILYSENITIQKVSVYGGHDGVDIRSCDRVLIENCTLHTGDDSVAGYDNNDVVVRNCDLQSACHIFRFGGTHVLIENCVSSGPCGFGYRGHLSEEKKKSSALTDETCRHTSAAAFIYFCDHRIKIRKEPGDIIVRGCTFGCANRIFRMEFGLHKWCCNTPLRSITFEDCSFPELGLQGTVIGDENAPIRFTMKRCRIGKMENAEDFALLECEHFEEICLEDITFENFPNPKILIKGEGKVRLVRSDELKIVQMA